MIYDITIHTILLYFYTSGPLVPERKIKDHEES